MVAVRCVCVFALTGSCKLTPCTLRVCASFIVLCKDTRWAVYSITMVTTFIKVYEGCISKKIRNVSEKRRQKLTKEQYE